jgi:hypothetical protein
MKVLRVAVLIAAGCIGVIISALLLFPAVCATVFPAPPAEGGDAPGLASVPENATALLVEQVSDDERLESLIAGASIPLLELSVEQIHAIYAQDDATLRSGAADLSSLAGNLYVETAVLGVSPENESARSHFIAALDEFVAASTLLGGGLPANRSVADDALGHLATGTERLSDALQGFNRPPADDSNATLASTGLDEESLSAFPNALRLGERFCYDDTRKENTASLIVSSITWSHTFQTSGTKPVQYTATSGTTYLMVAVRATHLGHREGVNTRIQTPAESAFTLNYATETYRPLTSPGPTNHGGSYSRVTLDRGESVTGYLFFEVPEDLDPAQAYLKVSTGGENPVWVLGSPA